MPVGRHEHMKIEIRPVPFIIDMFSFKKYHLLIWKEPESEQQCLWPWGWEDEKVGKGTELGRWDKVLNRDVGERGSQLWLGEAHTPPEA